MSQELQQAVIKQYCKSLRTPRIALEYPRFVRDATDNGWTYEEFLQRLLEAELLAREDSVAQRRIREARFPDLKTLDMMEWNELHGVERPAVQQLATCGFI
ncbi:MAG: ATP-binding protein, partial [Dehalococcoidia bacterium]|nr:ATP-binding protein [Dehalococcoidia bacterium]